MNQSLQMGFSDQINDLLVGGCITYIKVARKMIHTRTVRQAIGNKSANGILLKAAPEVDEAEANMLTFIANIPRVARTTQTYTLWSGYKLLFPEHFQAPYGILTSLTQLSARAVARQITLRAISLNVLNIQPILSHWIYGNDMEKLLNS